MDIRNAFLDTKIKEIEYEIKKLELHDKQAKTKELDITYKYDDESPCQKKAIQTIKFLKKNPNIYDIRINEIKID
jgi:hypothetical protein